MKETAYRLSIRYESGEVEEQIYEYYHQALEEAERIDTVEEAETEIDQIEVER